MKKRKRRFLFFEIFFFFSFSCFSFSILQRLKEESKEEKDKRKKMLKGRRSTTAVGEGVDFLKETQSTKSLSIQDMNRSSDTKDKPSNVDAGSSLRGECRV